MGKQWLLYKSSVDVGCHDTAKSSSTATTKSTGKSRKKGAQKHLSLSSSSSSTSSSGCMSAIFHLFDIQHHHVPLHPPSFISDSDVYISQEHNVLLKGVEAPRNSLELEEPEPMVEEVDSSSSLKHKQETNFNIPMGVIQIKTKGSGLMDDASSECSSSPCTKTPNLVARLMGLDLLPETSSPRPSSSSPRPSSSSSHPTPLLNSISKLPSHKINTRSLPSTPRVSAAARPSTEIDYHHRLSLQTNKENKRTYDENTRQYAKQIAEQVRENIKRRFGVDITNTMKNNEKRRDECLLLLKPKPPSQPSASNEFKSSNLGYANAKDNESCSPRFRLLDMKNNLNKPISNSSKLSSSSSTKDVCMKVDPLSSTIMKSPPLMKEEVVQVHKCKKEKTASEKYDVRLKKMHQHEEAFVKKCNKNKSTPLSNHLVNVNTTTKFISFKKDTASPSSSSTPTVLPPKQVPLKSITQLPSCQRRSYKTIESNKHSVQDNFSANSNGNGNGVAAITTTGVSVSDHFEYISRILSHIGIEKNTQISIANWYSPSHYPLHPTTFQQLEKLFHPTSTNFANRKFIFEVVAELLVEIVKPYISFNRWAGGELNSHRMDGEELIGKLCEKIGGFPAADCRVLEDIDGLIEGDMKRVVAFEEEVDEVAREMEREVVDTLVDEVAGIIWHVGCGGRV